MYRESEYYPKWRPGDEHLPHPKDDDIRWIQAPEWAINEIKRLGAINAELVTSYNSQNSRLYKIEDEYKAFKELLHHLENQISQMEDELEEYRTRSGGHAQYGCA